MKQDDGQTNREESGKTEPWWEHKSRDLGKL